MKIQTCMATLAVVMLTCAPALAADNPQAALGEKLYQQRCAACHAIDSNGYAPRHRGVVGRKAGSQPGYNYSSALKNSGIVWSEANIDLWLQGPSKMVPGTRMGFHDDNATERAAIIAYLKTQK
ncbi:c-type cytochrome [Asticcacaulis sp. EMRT-3]|uniref:c-type cytochrome n=1 Tax=Asticcacaulis sp. EMRT-3 TaxID=3040349 RepID=UPI0024AEF0EF|nr:c-type cytochrome [Asticcacaulis sp. EMRT-3]MDI7775606.1 c-type cytochrome [Asticcacaulis sp. EMRT-3]